MMFLGAVLSRTLKLISLHLNRCVVDSETLRFLDALLDAHIALVRERMRSLRRLADELQRLRARCGPKRPGSQCAILDGLAKTAAREPQRPAA